MIKVLVTGLIIILSSFIYSNLIMIRFNNINTITTNIFRLYFWISMENFAILVISTPGSLVFSLIKLIIGFNGIFIRESRNFIIRFLSIME